MYGQFVGVREFAKDGSLIVRVLLGSTNRLNGQVSVGNRARGWARIRDVIYPAFDCRIGSPTDIQRGYQMRGGDGNTGAHAPCRLVILVDDRGHDADHTVIR